MTDIQTQYEAVRSGIGLIDRSAVGKIAVYGEDRFSWLQGMVSSDVRLLQNGTPAVQACILDATGHILSDISLINVIGNEPFVLMALPAANLTKIFALLDKYIIMEDVEVRDVTSQWGCLSPQGPRALYYLGGRQRTFREEMINPQAGGTIEAEADHTGSGGWDWFVSQEMAAFFIRKWGEKHSIPLVGAEAQEILRVEAGIPKYGADMDESTLAPEAGLMATHISLTKGCYVGQEIVARIDSRGHTNRALTGFVFDRDDAPAPGDKIIAMENGQARETGRITSAIAASPALDGRPIALGYARHEHRAPDSILEVAGADKTRFARVVTLPFYRRPKPDEAAANPGTAA